MSDETGHGCGDPSVCYRCRLAESERKLAEAERKRAHTEQWYAERCERLWHWAHEDKEHRGDYFCIMANGSKMGEPPTYAQLLNRTRHRAELAEEKLEESECKLAEANEHAAGLELSWHNEIRASHTIAETQRRQVEESERKLAVYRDQQEQLIRDAGAMRRELDESERKVARLKRALKLALYNVEMLKRNSD